MFNAIKAKATTGVVLRAIIVANGKHERSPSLSLYC
jgi:hypothetical protein